MDRGFAVGVLVAAAALVAIQPLVNAQLGRELGSLQAVFVSFVIGTVAIGVVMLAVGGGVSGIGSVANVPWYYLVGGLMGAAYVTAAVYTVGTLGAAGVTAATIAGQLVMSLVADHFGWLADERRPITVSAVLGVGLLAAGTWMIIARD